LQKIISNLPPRSRKEVPFYPKLFPLKRNLKTLLDEKRKRRNMAGALAAGRELGPGF